MGLFDSIGNAVGGFFGGGEEKSEPQKVGVYTPEQKKLMQELISNVTSGGFGPAASAPQMYTPTTQNEQAYLDWARSEAVKNMASGQVPYDVSPEASKALWESTQLPLYNYQWQNTVLPGLQEQYAGSTFASTGRDEAVRKALQEWGLNVASTEGKFLQSEEEARRKAIENAQGRVLQTGEAIGKAGEYSRAVESERVMDQVTRFLMGESVGGQYNMAYNPQVQLALSLLGLSPYVVGQQAQGTGAGLGYGILTGASQGLGKLFGNMRFA